jgi:hypothetical protein
MKQLRRINAATRIHGVNTYVRDVTAAPVGGRSRRCQGLHNAAFLPYGSMRVERLGTACPSIASMGLYFFAALPGG